MFFEFSMVDSKMDPNSKMSSVLDMEVEPVTTTYQIFWKLEDQRLYDTLGTKPSRYPYTNRGSTEKMDQLLWGNLTKVMGSGIGDMIQAQHIQRHTAATPSAHAGRREFYIELALTKLMSYSQVYTESGIPKIGAGSKCTMNMLTMTTVKS